MKNIYQEHDNKVIEGLRETIKHLQATITSLQDQKHTEPKVQRAEPENMSIYIVTNIKRCIFLYHLELSIFSLSLSERALLGLSSSFIIKILSKVNVCDLDYVSHELLLK